MTRPASALTAALLAVLGLGGLTPSARPAADAPEFGIERYEPITTSAVVGFPDPPPPYVVRRVMPNYRPGFPVVVRAVPGTDQLLVVTQPSPYAPTVLSRIKHDPAAADRDAVKVMDLPAGGVAYDLTFHPKFADNGYLYLGWNGPLTPGGKKHSQITRYTMARTPPYALGPASAQPVIAWESDGHNGAAVCFGTDGDLYVTSGDGTSDSDTNLTGQRTDLLLAKVLRIDVDHTADGKPYSVPKDNPFVGDGRFAPETWAYGLRNPWRIAADPQTGHVWVGNNGQDLWEQAYLIRKGENYGWSVMEGSHPFYPNRAAGPTPFSKPTVEHHHSEARSLTGGVVYHGTKLPELKGAYVYGDYSTGRIWAVKHDGDKIVWHKELAVSPMRITAFALDPAGELLICDHAAARAGGFSTLEPNPKTTADPLPRTLTAGGLFDSVKDHRLKPGALPYSVNAPFWSDGLVKERYLVLPPGGAVGYRRENGFEFPDKTVVVKSFAVEEREGDPASRRWVETRFLTKQGGEWYGYSYVWNETGTDATLVPAGGTDRTLTVATPAGPRQQVWHLPSRAECMVCHSRAANFVLGLCEPQLNKSHTYPNGRSENQLSMLERLGLLRLDGQTTPRPGTGDRLPLPPAELGRLVDPDDPANDLGLRARSWLHANCSACHVEAGGGNARMNLAFGTPPHKMLTVGEKPVHDGFGLADARLIAPGSPDRSVLVHRAATRGRGQMPPLSSNRPDAAGVELLKAWCRSLGK
ncbi:MAG: PQQ-dependent sugar dehydrogenase [Gemmataceae bacterium]|nr:PQQ-dependent sugar dehydrogenase [Gemmataceae bacterium]